MSIPDCCHGCPHFVTVDRVCEILVKRNLRAWVGEQPCRIPHRIERLVRKRGLIEHDAEDAVHDIVARLIDSSSDPHHRIPTSPQEAFRWCQTLSQHVLTDRARRKLGMGGRLPQTRKKCGTCIHRARTSGVCTLVMGVDPPSGKPRTNPHHGSTVSYDTNPASLSPPCPHHEPRFEPMLGLPGGELGADRFADLLELETKEAASSFTAHLKRIDPELPSILDLVRTKVPLSTIATRVGISIRTLHRRLHRIEQEYRLFFDIDEET